MDGDVLRRLSCMLRLLLSLLNPPSHLYQSGTSWEVETTWDVNRESVL